MRGHRAVHAWQRHGQLGDDPFLAFVNTVNDTGKTRVENGIPDPETLLHWAIAAGVVSEADDCQMPSKGDFKALLELREVGWSVLHCLATGTSPPATNLKIIGVAVGETMKRAKLVYSDGTIAWQATVAAHLLRDRLILSLDRLLRSVLLDTLTECDRCTALFLAIGRGPRRKFCRAQTCGNRSKVERYRSSDG
jgi:predicted RNA-binding Zn ribbon-like protein